jgi:hypothetical protein
LHALMDLAVVFPSEPWRTGYGIIRKPATTRPNSPAA